MRPGPPTDTALPDPGLARWLPLYLALLAAAVLSPGLLACAARPLSWEPAASDVTLNLLLFVPLVWLAPPRTRKWAWVAAALLSLGVEVAQQWFFRTPSVFDWLANTGGAVAATLLPDPPWHHLRRRAVGLAALLAAATGLAGALYLERTSPPVALGGWTPMPVVLGCEEPGKAHFEGTVRGVAVFDHAVTPTEADRWADDGPIYALDFVHQRYWRDGPEGRAPLTLPDPPEDFRLAQDGLHYGPTCWRLPPEHGAHILGHVRGLSVLLDLVTPPEENWQIHRVFSMTNMHMVRDFMTATRGDLAFLWFRTNALEDEYLDPLGPPAFGPIPAGAPARILFTVDAARTRTFVNGACVQERLLQALGRPFPIARGLGFTAAVLVAVAALGAGLLTRRAWVGVVAGAVMVGAVLALGLAEHMGVAQTAGFMVAALLGAAWGLRAQGLAEAE